MTGDRDHLIARTIRALRAHADMSRAGLGAKVDRSGGTIGRWERGEWIDGIPSLPTRQAIARICKADELRADLDAFEEDPAKRFADAARREAERQAEHPESEPEAHPDEDDEDEDD